MYNVKISMNNDLMTITVKENRQDTADCHTLIFTRPDGFIFTPGECADLSFPDSEMNFKTFSFSSSPTEVDLMVTYRDGWTDYKLRLAKLDRGDEMKMRIYGNTFNYHPEHHAVFIAGGIGITPFRSMLKFIWDNMRSEKKDKTNSGNNNQIDLIYLNNTEEFVFKEDLDEIKQIISNLNIHYIVTQKEGRLTREKLEKLVKFRSDSINYISGPPGMVDATVEILESMKIENIRIKTDSFDGYVEN